MRRLAIGLLAAAAMIACKKHEEAPASVATETVRAVEDTAIADTTIEDTFDAGPKLFCIANDGTGARYELDVSWNGKELAGTFVTKRKGATKTVDVIAKPYEATYTITARKGGPLLARLVAFGSHDKLDVNGVEMLDCETGPAE